MAVWLWFNTGGLGFDDEVPSRSMDYPCWNRFGIQLHKKPISGFICCRRKYDAGVWISGYHFRIFWSGQIRDQLSIRQILRWGAEGNGTCKQYGCHPYCLDVQPPNWFIRVSIPVSIKMRFKMANILADYRSDNRYLNNINHPNANESCYDK